MKKIARPLLIVLGIFLALALAMGCQQVKVKEGTRPVVKKEGAATPTKDNPLVVDTKEKKVMVYTEVNGRYFAEPSIHWGIVYQQGKVADKALFKSYADPMAFHAALVKIGAMPGDNLILEQTDGKPVDGEALKVTASWGSQKNLPLAKVIRDPNGKDFDIRFGGNLPSAEEKQTGCIMCLESCPISITSNALYPQGGYKNPVLKFTANQDNLPPDGGAVIFTFALRFGEGRTPSVQTTSPDEMPTPVKPLLVNTKDKEIRIYTEVNGIHLFEPTVHWGIVFKDGKYGDRAILKSFANQNDFYEALVRIGAKPGNNLKLGETTGQTVKGDELSVAATWPGLGKELNLADVFADSNGKGFEIRFGGNQKPARTKNTGCITCLESCPIAVTSNARYPQTDVVKRFLAPNSRFQGKADVLPEDGKPVILIYRLSR